MAIFKQTHDNGFWRFTDGTAEPMWLNVHGVGHAAYQYKGGEGSSSTTATIAYFEADSFAPLSFEESQQRGDKYWSGDDYSALVNPRQLSEDEVQAFLAKLPVFGSSAPAPAPA